MDWGSHDFDLTPLWVKAYRFAIRQFFTGSGLGRGLIGQGSYQSLKVYIETSRHDTTDRLDMSRWSKVCDKLAASRVVCHCDVSKHVRASPAGPMSVVRICEAQARA